MASLLGWLTFPLAYRLLPALKDRGYTASRTLGLLLWGYTFWSLASLGVLRNDPGSLFFALALVVALSAWALRGIRRQELLAWWRSHRRLVLVSEVLFVVAFAALTLVRAANPEAVGTEKPMELAFINAILNSPTFPPHDPWLSGFAISYYYFGYIMVAMLAKITATPGAVAFNLGISLIFGLSAVGAYGLVYNLLNARRCSEPDPAQGREYTLPALLGPLYVLIVSNLEGFLHALHTRGLFWHREASGELTSAFWRWLDINDLNLPPQEPFAWVPTRFWWWWRASRVLQDYDLGGNSKEIIDEFPFFSYLLADLHPHVLVMPFTFLAVTLALNLFLGGAGGELGWLRRKVNLRTLAWIGTLAIPLGIPLITSGAINLKLSIVGMGILALLLGGIVLVYLRSTLNEHGIGVLLRGDLGTITLGVPLKINLPQLLLAGVVLGGMAFLNTWDFPFYVALYAAAYALSRALEEGKRIAATLRDFVWLGLATGVCGGLLYLPFYLGFSSQAGGILPNLIYPTRGAHLWVMFAPLLVPIIAFMLYLVNLARDRRSLKAGFQLTLGITILLWIFSLFLGFAIVIIPQVGDFYQSTLSSPGARELFLAALTRRVTSPGGWLTLFFLLTLVLSSLLHLDETGQKENGILDSEPVDQTFPLPDPYPPSPANSFVLLLILLGTLLVLGPEFVYLRDLFGWRMNTIFKFYYQAWLVWSLAAAYGSISLFGRLRRFWGLTFPLLWLLVTGMSLVYPAFSLWNKTNGFQPSEWTLDSTAYIERESPEEMAAIRWLESAPPGVVAEAVPPEGGSYTHYGRVSKLSGKPAVLGWVGHESQWRGGGEAMGSRQSDLERLYCSRDWDETQAILDQYGVRYVFVSPLERSNYHANASSCPIGLVESKFIRYLEPGYKQGSVTIYEYVPDQQ